MKIILFILGAVIALYLAFKFIGFLFFWGAVILAGVIGWKVFNAKESK